MTFVYSAGSTTPVVAGLAEFGGLRINDGSFHLDSAGWMLDVPPARVTLTPNGGSDGAASSQAFYGQRDFELKGSFVLSSVDDIGAAVERLRGAFNLLGGNSALVAQHRSWPQRRQLLARCLGGLVITEPSGPAVARIPRRDFTAHMVAADPRWRTASGYNSTLTASLTGGTATITPPNIGNYIASYVVDFTGPFPNGATLTAPDPAAQASGGTLTLTVGAVAAGETVRVDTDYRTVQVVPTGSLLTTVGTNAYSRLQGPMLLRYVRPGGTTITVTASGATTAASQVIVYNYDVWV